MREMPAHEFRSHMREAAEDWEREQETLYVLQNKSLMEQIGRSLKTQGEGSGHRLSSMDQDALDCV